MVAGGLATDDIVNRFHQSKRRRYDALSKCRIYFPARVVFYILPISYLIPTGHAFN